MLLITDIWSTQTQTGPCKVSFPPSHNRVPQHIIISTIKLCLRELLPLHTNMNVPLTLSTLLLGFRMAGTFLSTRFFNHNRELNKQTNKNTCATVHTGQMLPHITMWCPTRLYAGTYLVHYLHCTAGKGHTLHTSFNIFLLTSNTHTHIHTHTQYINKHTQELHSTSFLSLPTHTHTHNT